MREKGGCRVGYGGSRMLRVHLSLGRQHRIVYTALAASLIDNKRTLSCKSL